MKNTLSLKSVVKYCRGLPLALTVLGSYLKSRSTKSMWISELEKLKRFHMRMSSKAENKF